MMNPEIKPVSLLAAIFESTSKEESADSQPFEPLIIDALTSTNPKAVVVVEALPTKPSLSKNSARLLSAVQVKPNRSTPAARQGSSPTAPEANLLIQMALTDVASGKASDSPVIDRVLGKESRRGSTFLGSSEGEYLESPPSKTLPADLINTSCEGLPLNPRIAELAEIPVVDLNTTVDRIPKIKVDVVLSTDSKVSVPQPERAFSSEPLLIMTDTDSKTLDLQSKRTPTSDSFVELTTNIGQNLAKQARILEMEVDAAPPRRAEVPAQLWSDSISAESPASNLKVDNSVADETTMSQPVVDMDSLEPQRSERPSLPPSPVVKSNISNMTNVSKNIDDGQKYTQNPSPTTNASPTPVPKLPSMDGIPVDIRQNLPKVAKLSLEEPKIIPPLPRSKQLAPTVVVQPELHVDDGISQDVVAQPYENIESTRYEISEQVLLRAEASPVSKPTTPIVRELPKNQEISKPLISLNSTEVRVNSPHMEVVAEDNETNLQTAKTDIIAQARPKDLPLTVADISVLKPSLDGESESSVSMVKQRPDTEVIDLSKPSVKLDPLSTGLQVELSKEAEAPESAHSMNDSRRQQVQHIVRQAVDRLVNASSSAVDSKKEPEASLTAQEAIPEPNRAELRLEPARVDPMAERNPVLRGAEVETESTMGKHSENTGFSEGEPHKESKGSTSHHTFERQLGRERAELARESMRSFEREVAVKESSKNATIRVEVDADLAVEVSTRGDRVQVTIEGSRDSLLPLRDLGRELGNSLARDGFTLDTYDTREQKFSNEQHGQDPHLTSKNTPERSAESPTSRRIPRGSLVDRIA